MAVKKVNADLEVAGTVMGNGVNLNDQITLLNNLIPEEPLPLNALEFEDLIPETAGVAQAAGYNYAYGINPGDENVPNIIGIQYPHWLTVNLDRFGKADLGELRLYLNEELKDTLDLPTAVIGHGDAVILISRVTYNNFEPFQKGQARVVSSATLGVEPILGANKIRLEHWVDGALYGSGEIILFWDGGTVGVTMVSGINTIIIPSNTIPPTSLSGVLFMPMDGMYHVKVALNDVFKNTFLLTPLTIIGADSGIADAAIPYDDVNVSGVSIPPVNTDVLQYDHFHQITLEKFSTDAKIQCTAGDPAQTFAAQDIPITGNCTLLVNSLSGHQSTETRELFKDEYYRLPLSELITIPGNITGQWTSSNILADGNSQVFGALIYPVTNFSVLHMPMTGQPNYSGLTGERQYLRVIRETNMPHNSGTLELDGFTLSDIELSGNIKVEIKLPSQTGWLDLGLPYNAGTFTGVTGEGCRTGVENGNEFSWTAGQFSTADSGWMIAIRITHKNTSAPALNEIREIGWEA